MIQNVKAVVFALSHARVNYFIYLKTAVIMNTLLLSFRRVVIVVVVHFVQVYVPILR